jgi:uncharacterized membrane protein YpjA
MSSLRLQQVPDAPELPGWLAPIPRPIEDLGLRLAGLVAVINLLGTAFGFWYYRFQFFATPAPMWPLVPDSPLATLFAAGAFGAFAVGRSREWLNALAFFGNIILGLWTPYSLLVFYGEWGNSLPMFLFLFFSHLAMVVQAFVIYRFSEFPTRAVAVATTWYTANLLVDYHIPILPSAPDSVLHGPYHHTWVPVTPDTGLWLGATAHDTVAAGATVLLLLATFLALATRIKLLEAGQ